MKIGILSQWYDPEPGPAALPGVLARELARRGHEVKVLTGFPNYPTGQLAEGYRIKPRMVENLDGVEVTRTALIPNHSQSGLGRILNYGSFGITAAILGDRALKDIDVLWVNYSPITVALPMFVQRARRTRVVCEVADLWPDTMLVAGLSGASRLAVVAKPLLNAWTNAMYRASDFVVHIAPSVGSVLQTRGVPVDKIRFIPKPANEQHFHRNGKSLRSELGLDEGDIVILYAGAMGTAQDLSSLVLAVALVQDPRLKLILAGSGTEESALRKLAAGDDRVVFLGRRPMDQMADLMATADASYIGLADHPLSRMTMPSKTQTILASGKASIVAAEGDVADVIGAAEAGYITRSGDPQSIASVLSEVLADGRETLADMGQRARDEYARSYSVTATTDAVETLLMEAASVGKPQTIHSTRLHRDEIDTVAALHIKSFPDFFLSKLGLPFLKQFYAGFLDDPTAVTVVERDPEGRPMGVAVGCTEPQGFFRRLLKNRWLGFVGASAAFGLREPWAIPRLIRAVKYRGDSQATETGALLSSICVDPGSQGTGTGKRLLCAWTSYAKAQGAQRAFLTTDAQNNDEVRAFYERQGWSVYDTHTTREGRYMVRYSIDLTDHANYQQEESGK